MKEKKHTFGLSKPLVCSILCMYICNINRFISQKQWTFCHLSLGWQWYSINVIVITILCVKTVALLD